MNKRVKRSNQRKDEPHHTQKNKGTQNVSLFGASDKMLFLAKKNFGELLPSELADSSCLVYALNLHLPSKYKGESSSSPLMQKIKGHKMCPFLAQAVRFELTCLYGKLISSQPRYDHFDTLAYLVRL